ncbi:MAG: phage holin family protein [Nocardiopsaceae bacterium]|nr:phage holin family protein [Nocardiopsaceae bacterium]
MPETQPGDHGPEEFNAAEYSLGELVSEARGDVSRLVRLELELAKLELAHDASRVAKGSAMFIVAAVMGHMVLILASITLGLGLWAAGLQPVVAFLIVTLAYLLIAGLLIFIGVRQLKKRRGLPRTSQTMENTAALLRRERPVSP